MRSILLGVLLLTGCVTPAHMEKRFAAERTIFVRAMDKRVELTVEALVAEIDKLRREYAGFAVEMRELIKKNEKKQKTKR